MSYLDIFGLKLWKTIVKIEVNTLEFVITQSLVWNKKVQDLEHKRPYLGIFAQKTEKKDCHISNHPFEQNKNLSNLGSKIPYMGIFGL